MKNLSAKCPTCGRAVQVPSVNAATTVRRTCRNCRTEWSIEIQTTPVITQEPIGHKLTFRRG